jgi:hypothetical protein
MTKVLVLLVTVISASSISLAYDVGTHSRISREAAVASSLPTVLTMLQMSLNTKLDATQIARRDNDGTAVGWIREGSIREDGEGNCDTRVRNHFYNPINNAGYFRGAFQGAPSPDWGLEDVAANGGQDFSYADARNYFWNALTATDGNEHDHNLALTFRSLGQVIHLIQDAAQPQHTRNDSHAGFSCPATLGLFGPRSLYEAYVDELATTNTLGYSGYPNAGLIQPRHYWDDESGNGIAEFTNRNFVSAGTNFLGPPDDLRPAPGFPSPNKTGSSLKKEDIKTLIPGTSLSGTLTFIGTPYDDRYLGTTGRNDRTSTYSIFTADLTRRNLLPGYSLNRFNFDAASSLLVPRAVGYSAGLLDYFFRGKLEIAAPDEYAYAVAPYSTGKETFTKLKLKVRDATVGAHAGSGTIRAIVRYRPSSASSPLLWPYYAILREPFYAVSAARDVTLTPDYQQVTFDFTDHPIPIDIGDVSVIVAFRGPLSSPYYTEPDSIAFGGKDVFEPQLIDVTNSADYDCYQSALYDVVGLTPPQRDPNNDGIQDLFGPWTEAPTYFRIQPYDMPATPLSSRSAHYEIPNLSWAQYGRFVTIQDRDWYRLVYNSPDTLDTSTGLHAPFLVWWGLQRNLNHVIEQNGKEIHEVGSYGSVTYRGTFAPLHANFINSKVGTNQTCLDAMPSRPRNLTEVAGIVDFNQENP